LAPQQESPTPQQVRIHFCPCALHTRCLSAVAQQTRCYITLLDCHSAHLSHCIRPCGLHRPLVPPLSPHSLFPAHYVPCLLPPAVLIGNFVTLATGGHSGHAAGVAISQPALLGIYAAVLILLGLVNTVTVRALGVVGEISGKGFPAVVGSAMVALLCTHPFSASALPMVVQMVCQGLVCAALLKCAAMLQLARTPLTPPRSCVFCRPCSLVACACRHGVRCAAACDCAHSPVSELGFQPSHLTRPSQASTTTASSSCSAC
jgi:hypothetical protein